MRKFNIEQAFGQCDGHWRPRVVAELNGQEVKVVKAEGTFPWHQHEHEDEMFFVWRGRFRVDFPDATVELGPGEFIVVPRGVEHRTAADEEALVMIFEPAMVVNTGNITDENFTTLADPMILADSDD